VIITTLRECAIGFLGKLPKENACSVCKYMRNEDKKGQKGISAKKVCEHQLVAGRACEKN
jgi:hypothetical protein